MTKIKLIETAFRDAHQSLLATRMRTRDMLPIAEKMDKVGYFSIECWGGATFDTCIRYLNEDPWQRLRDIKELVKKTPLQMLLRTELVINATLMMWKRIRGKAYTNGVDVFGVRCFKRRANKHH